jgi:hypothetical protein
MVMVLFRGICHPDLQYLAISIRETKCTRLGYKTRLSRLHSMDPPLALAFLRSSHLVTAGLEQENNQGTPDKLQVP